MMLVSPFASIFVVNINFNTSSLCMQHFKINPKEQKLVQLTKFESMDLVSIKIRFVGKIFGLQFSYNT